VWVSGVIYFVVVTQLFNFSYLQGMSMYHKLGPHFTIPPASIYAICYLVLALFVTLYDTFLVPLISKITKIEGGITILQRQGIGIVFVIISNVVGALVAKKIQDSSLSSDGTSSLSVFWLTPQLALLGISQGFGDVGQLEFYNMQFPEHMSALATAVFYASMACANYLCTLMVNTVDNITSKNRKMAWINDEIFLSRLDLFYYTVAILGIVNLFYFLICAYFYQYKDIKMHREFTDSDYNEINDSGTDEFHQEPSTTRQTDSDPSTQFDS
jgi:dipeptide/tripeptide permease